MHALCIVIWILHLYHVLPVAYVPLAGLAIAALQHAGLVCLHPLLAMLSSEACWLPAPWLRGVERSWYRQFSNSARFTGWNGHVQESSSICNVQGVGVFYNVQQLNGNQLCCNCSMQANAAC